MQQAAGPANVTLNPHTCSAATIDGFDQVQKKVVEEAGLVDESSNKSFITLRATATHWRNPAGVRLAVRR